MRSGSHKGGRTRGWKGSLNDLENQIGNPSARRVNPLAIFDGVARLFWGACMAYAILLLILSRR